MVQAAPRLGRLCIVLPTSCSMKTQRSSLTHFAARSPAMPATPKCCCAARLFSTMVESASTMVPPLSQPAATPNLTKTNSNSPIWSRHSSIYCNSKNLENVRLSTARLVNRLQIFEVDHPASQAWKRARVGELGIADPEWNLHHVFAIDFERQALGAGLAASVVGPRPTGLSIPAWRYAISDEASAGGGASARFARDGRARRRTCPSVPVAYPQGSKGTMRRSVTGPVREWQVRLASPGSASSIPRKWSVSLPLSPDFGESRAFGSPRKRWNATCEAVVTGCACRPTFP